ncbi:hypothetical protein L2E82_27834 [Cichorium intybus]|uniref:Uncharacterized protein n=1 Tax=Cichorium intybus TaxID=13427 RepID=A0ACB9CU89_CICIN|nr:hypothetical protein L2E82_27834 [Cichorium intybus]
MNESNPNLVQKNDSNLPQGGLNDDAYWLDLPHDGSSHDIVKKGSLQDASSYLHVKPISSGVFTDIAIWVFYLFNVEHGKNWNSSTWCVLLGSGWMDIGVRDKMMDTRVKVVVIVTKYMESAVIEPP